MTKISRREFLTTAAAAIASALTARIVKTETPVPVEDIQAVPLTIKINVMMRRLIDTIDAATDSLRALEASMYDARFDAAPAWRE